MIPEIFFKIMHHLL